MEKPLIIDVRTPLEFMGGHVNGSMNIPLQELNFRIEELRNRRNIILCCASGARSEQAARYLQAHGIECVNGGPWTRVNHLVNNTN
ncbi:MAG: hypothetical protein RL213_124 [Bacteroidota bacterium]|jgi:rhodanese-related sulfurtransferase